MTQALKIDRDKTAVVIMDFQQRIVANNASDPDGVVTVSYTHLTLPTILLV